MAFGRKRLNHDLGIERVCIGTALILTSAERVFGIDWFVKMSLSRWLLGTSPPAAKKAKTSEEKKDIQRQYEAKRERKYNKSWEREFPWLYFSESEQKMFCRVCKKFSPHDDLSSFVRGSSNFRIDPIRKHWTSEQHKRNRLKENARVSVPGTTTAAKTLTMLNKAAVNKLCVLFRNAHFVAKMRRPFTDFVQLCQLDVAKGTDIGKTYLTDKYCQKFLTSIADSERDNQKSRVEEVPFISIISDGSTDCSSKETEIVYLRSSLKCEVKTFFVGVKHIGKADGAGITRAISSLLDGRFGDIWHQKIVAMGTDGASVMLGNKSGVVKRMAELTNRPFLKGIHCSAHRLELAYKDAVKGISIHQKCELLLTNLYLFYKYSPLNRSNLNIAAESLKKSVKVPSRPGGTRWLPHTQRAIKTVLDGADVIILHLEQIQQEPRKEASAKARNFLKVLKDKSSRFWLHLMLDVVKALSHVSVTIQNNTCTLADIYSELESVKQILQKYKTSDGPFLRTLTESTEDEFSSLGSTRIRLLDSIIDKLTVRFGGDSALFRASSILCVDKWPKDFSTDIEYGDEHVCAAVNISGPALRESCPNMDVEAIETEWTRLKTTLTTRKHTVTDLTSLEGTFGESFPNLFLLLNFLLTQPGSSVEAERGFSCMKMVKSDWRSRLGEQNLSDLMMVTLELPEVGKFDPLPCVELWYGSGQRARRPFYKDELKKCYLPRETDTSDHESMVEVSAEIRGEAVIPDDGMMMDDSIEDDNVVPDEDLDALVEGETENYDASDDDDEDEEAELSRKDLIAMQQRAYRMFLDMIC